jgi:hypothetical protein
MKCSANSRGLLIPSLFFTLISEEVFLPFFTLFQEKKSLLLFTTDLCDVNVTPDKRVILLHSETALIDSVKVTSFGHLFIITILITIYS